MPRTNFDQIIHLAPDTQLVLRQDGSVEISSSTIDRVQLGHPTRFLEPPLSAPGAAPFPTLRPEPGVYRLVFSYARVSPEGPLTVGPWLIIVPQNGRSVLLPLEAYTAMQSHLASLEDDPAAGHPPWQRLAGDLAAAAYDRFLDELEAAARAVQATYR